MEVKGKKAVVFGGTSGIGLATTMRLSDLGAEVVAISRDPDKAGTMPANVTLRQCDVRDEENVKALLADCGPYDILVSAATGGNRAIGPFADMEMDGFKGSFDKLWGYANVIRHGIEHLTEKGAIVVVSGSPARRCGPGQVAISSVGGAVEALVRAVAKEIPPIRINVMSPGLISTPMVPLQGQERDDFYNKMTGNNLIPRPGSADECAHGVMFLIENDLSPEQRLMLMVEFLLS